MARKQALSPDATSYIRVGIRGPDKPWRGQINTIQFINGAPVPPLCDEWQERLAKHLGRSLSPREGAWLEGVIGIYVAERALRVNPIPWNELLKRLKAVSTASKVLQAELNDRSAAAAAMWERIGKAYSPFKPANILKKEVFRLTECIEAASVRARADKASGKGRSHSTPWHNLVYSLYDMFQNEIGKPTVAHNSRGANPKQSAFVEFVWAVITAAVPATHREHTQSKSAMARAISIARSEAPSTLRDDSRKLAKK